MTNDDQLVNSNSKYHHSLEKSNSSQNNALDNSMQETQFT